MAESDSIRLFAPSSYLGSRLLSYGLGFRAQVFVENLVMTAPFVLYLRGSRLNQYLVATMAVSVVNNDTYVLMVSYGSTYLVTQCNVLYCKCIVIYNVCISSRFKFEILMFGIICVEKTLIFFYCMYVYCMYMYVLWLLTI